jgi:hypothetical protein
MKYLTLMIALIALLNAGCTDAARANLGAYGNEHRVRMYNGGVLVAEWTSTGKVTSLENSDGWQFMDKETGKLVRVGGDVIIEVID